LTYFIQRFANSAAARLSVSVSRDTVHSAASNAFAHRVVLDVSLWIKERWSTEVLSIDNLRLGFGTSSST
jgi:hypothetical protein